MPLSRRLARLPRFLGRVAPLATAMALMAALACVAPTLPLPPPSLPTVSQSQTPGLVHLSSSRGVEPGALVVIYNRNPAVPLSKRVGGAQADAEGSWETEVIAQKGDLLDVTQELGTTRSAPVTVRIP